MNTERDLKLELLEQMVCTITAEVLSLKEELATMRHNMIVNADAMAVELRINRDIMRQQQASQQAVTRGLAQQSSSNNWKIRYDPQKYRGKNLKYVVFDEQANLLGRAFDV